MWQRIPFVNALLARVERLEQSMSDQTVTIGTLTTEVESIKTAFDAFQQNVLTQIASLQAQIAADQPDLTALSAAINTLQSDVAGATLTPPVPNGTPSFPTTSTPGTTSTQSPPSS